VGQTGVDLRLPGLPHLITVRDTGRSSTATASNGTTRKPRTEAGDLTKVTGSPRRYLAGGRYLNIGDEGVPRHASTPAE
jgi:hypothetical protein